MDVVRMRLSLIVITEPINSLFQNALPDAELAALLKALAENGYVAINGTKVVYSPSE